MKPLPPSDDARAEAAVLQAMVLFSTLTTASEVWHAARERRAGRDPSEQEVITQVRGYLKAGIGELQALLLQLRASLIAGVTEEAPPVSRFVRRFNDLMTLRQVSGLLQVIHQRLLSLYPDVSETLLEEARVLYQDSGLLLDVDEALFGTTVEPFAEQAMVFATKLHRALTEH